MIYNIICLVPSIQVTAQSITILEGQSITFSCIPTPGDLMVNWTMDSDSIGSFENISLSPEHLQHSLTIRNAIMQYSGEYVCNIVDFAIAKTIRLNVIQGKFNITSYVCISL